MPDEVDVGAGRRQGMVDPHVTARRRRVRAGPVGDTGVEGARLALRCVGRREVLQRERERRKLPVRVEPGRFEHVVGAAHVGEATALHDEDGPLVAEQPAESDPGQQHHQGDVEHQVAGLPQVALLGGEADRTALLRPHVDPPPGPAQQTGGPVDHGRHRLVALPPVAGGQPLQVPRRGRRAAAQRAGVQPDPGHQATDERDEQQQVDRGEPGRGEHVEHRERVEEGAQVRVRRDIAVDLDGVQAALRQQRPGDRRQSQQGQQEQRRAHARQLPPAGPQRPARSARTRRHRRGRGGRQPFRVLRRLPRYDGPLVHDVGHGLSTAPSSRGRLRAARATGSSTRR